jgi:hypothetical protein
VGGEAGSHSGFLPPEAAGPEPDLDRPSTALPPPPSQQFAPPAEAEAHATPVPSAQGTAPSVPNGQAVAGLSLSIGSLTLLAFSAGMSTIISIACAAMGIHYSKTGRARVDRGETTQNRGVAQAGYVMGIVALVLSILCTIGWIAFGIVYATDEGFRQDIKDGLDDGNGDAPEGVRSSLQLAAITLRLVGALLR